MVIDHSVAYGENKIIPILGTTFTVEHLFVETLSHGANSTHLTCQDGSNIFCWDTQFDEQTGVVFHVGHRVETAQL